MPEGEPTVILHWLPLGAGGHLVRFSGGLWERLAARREHRAPRPLFHSALEILRQIVQLSQARSGIILSPPAAKRRLRQADKGGRVEWPLEERHIAKHVQIAPGGGIPFEAAPSPRQQDEGEIRPFLLRLDPAGQRMKRCAG